MVVLLSSPPATLEERGAPREGRRRHVSAPIRTTARTAHFVPSEGDLSFDDYWDPVRRAPTRRDDALRLHLTLGGCPGVSMDAANEREVSGRSFVRQLLLAAAVASLATACNGAITNPSGFTPTGTGTAGTGGTAGIGGGTAGTAAAPRDVGRVSIHRLNNLEYDNTMKDLLGVDAMARATFQPDETGEYFDNNADAFTMNDARYEQYFTTADTIGEQVFADTTPTGLRQTYVYGLVSPACTPSATDTTCSSKIISAFAQKAWRRPVSPADLTDLVKLATDAVTLGETADGAIKQVVKTLLASPPFLYRIEYDTNPASLTPHALDPYELATRLSYLVWSSMPDKRLFDLAASKQILTDATLGQEVDRMLADPRGANFTQSFAGQWLGARVMQAHQVEPTAFTSFDDTLRAAMIQEQQLYFNEFLNGPLPMTQFFTASENFVNTRLAKHYGFPAVAATAGFQKVMNADPNRVGFMGLGSFLTLTSFSYRTSPTLRGRWLLENLLCNKISPPAGLIIPKLDTKPATDPSQQQENVRARLEMHRMAVECANCHSILDPIGLGLENFDGIGAYRTKYSPTMTTTIDASGMLPTGEMFSSVAQLATILSTGDHANQLTDCATRKVMNYALSRELTDADNPYVSDIHTTWSTQGWGLKALLKDVVLNDTFRFRHGEM
jgi:hypothetical protein